MLFHPPRLRKPLCPHLTRSGVVGLQAVSKSITPLAVATSKCRLGWGNDTVRWRTGRYKLPELRLSAERRRQGSQAHDTPQQQQRQVDRCLVKREMMMLKTCCVQTCLHPDGMLNIQHLGLKDESGIVE